MRANDLRPVRYAEGRLFVLDQTLLPGEEKYIELKTLAEVEEAIKKLRVRGAPAIGVAAAYGVVVALKETVSSATSMGISGDPQEGGLAEEDSGPTLDSAWALARDILGGIKEICDSINATRPTAVNLKKATDRMLKRAEAFLTSGATEDVESGIQIASKGPKVVLEGLIEALEGEAEAIRREDEEANLAMGEYGLSLLKPGMGILTHCNAGALATSCYGTCLSPIYLGQERGYGFKVFADETRPLLQGARLTAWELDRAGIDVTLICDNMAQTVMRKGWIDAVVVGCDRMAANGDGANKIGTAAVAILAKEFGIPFYMFVPTSTIDMETATGEDIEIELRSQDEIKEMWYNMPMAPKGVKAYNPAFDVTPNRYITAVITEKGIVRPPYGENLAALMRL